MFDIRIEAAAIATQGERVTDVASQQSDRGDDRPVLTDRQGHPVHDNQNQRTVGARGPATLENYEWHLRGSRARIFLVDHEITSARQLDGEMLERLQAELLTAGTSPALVQRRFPGCGSPCVMTAAASADDSSAAA